MCSRRRTSVILLLDLRRAERCCGRHELPARRPHDPQRWQTGRQRAAGRGLHAVLCCCRVHLTWTLCSSRCCESPSAVGCCGDRCSSTAGVGGLRLRRVDGPRAAARHARTLHIDSAVSYCTCSSRAARASSKGGARDAAHCTRSSQLPARDTRPLARCFGTASADSWRLRRSAPSHGPFLQSDPLVRCEHSVHSVCVR